MKTAAHTLALGLLLAAVGIGCSGGDERSSGEPEVQGPSLAAAHIEPLVDRLGRARRQWLQLAEGRAEQLPKVVMQLTELGPQVVPYVLPALDSPNADTRYFAAQVLGSVGDRSIVDRMMLLLADPDPGVILVASEALGRIRDAETVPLLFRALETGRVRQVRWALVLEPVRPEDRELVPFLIARLLDGTESSRVSASLLLTHITGEEMAYDPSAPPDERAAAAMRWERWWSRVEGGSS